MTTANLSTKQVAALKGVTVKTVNLWAQQGKLPIAETEKLSGARFFNPKIVAEFNSKTTASSVATPPVPAIDGAAFTVPPGKRVAS